MCLAVLCGCSFQVIPQDPSTALIRFGYDSGEFDWDLDTDSFYVDGRKLGFFEYEVAVDPGVHQLNLTWRMTEDSDDDSSEGLIINSSKSGRCELSAQFLAGRGYKVGVLVVDSGSWLNDPHVRIRILDGTTDQELRSAPCSYSGRALIPEIVTR